MNAPNEPVWNGNAMRTLEARYLWRDASGAVAETPGEMLRRVARAVAAAEARYGASEDEVRRVAGRFHGAMAAARFLPNSPTLMNAGRALGVLSACFVLPIGDSIEEIFDSVKHAAQVQRAGGGTGFSFDRLRPTGDTIASSGGRTSGPISFWRVFSEATRAIQQGAFRRGANMGMMSVTHPDVLRFVTSKADLVAFENFNISVKVSDEFMRALRGRPAAPHVVTNPRTGRRYWLPKDLVLDRYSLAELPPASDPSAPPRPAWTVRDVWDLIVRSAHATGEPGLCFIDRVNRDNPTPNLGRIEATNPCGEQPLLDYEACNLGSIDLAKFVLEPGTPAARLDEPALREMIRLGVRFLDDVIDVNNYVIPAIEHICRFNRKIGLGVMGLADAMFSLAIRYDSPAGMDFARRVASILAEEAFAASEALAKARGSFPNWEGSVWSRHRRAMRNAAVTTIAPTGTLSILAGCSGGIEPAFALAFHRHILEGRSLLEVNEPFRRHAERRGFWSEDLARRLAGGERLRDIAGIDAATRDLFVTAHDVAPADHVRMQAAFQERVDGAISKTINLPAEASADDVDAVYRLAHQLGCKGVTVYRDGCRTGQPMATREAGGTPCPQCRSVLPADVGCARCPRCGAALCAL